MRKEGNRLVRGLTSTHFQKSFCFVDRGINQNIAWNTITSNADMSIGTLSVMSRLTEWITDHHERHDDIDDECWTFNDGVQSQQWLNRLPSGPTVGTSPSMRP